VPTQYAKKLCKTLLISSALPARDSDFTILPSILPLTLSIREEKCLGLGYMEDNGNPKYLIGNVPAETCRISAIASFSLQPLLQKPYFSVY